LCPMRATTEKIARARLAWSEILTQDTGKAPRPTRKKIGTALIRAVLNKQDTNTSLILLQAKLSF
jgi:hypothetical protein